MRENKPFKQVRRLCASLSLCLSVFVSVSLSLCLSVCVSLSVSFCLCLCFSASPSLSLCLSVCVSLSVSLCLCLCFSASLSLSLCLSVCVSLSFSLCLFLCVSASLSLSLCLYSLLYRFAHWFAGRRHLRQVFKAESNVLRMIKMKISNPFSLKYKCSFRQQHRDLGLKFFLNL
jgi:hypothetical protein